MPALIRPWVPLRPADPVATFVVITGVSTFCFTLCFTVNLVFMITEAGLDPFQLVLVGTVLEATCLLFEVPTGVVADRHSRRLSILVGFTLIGVGFGVHAVPSLGAIMLAQVLWGLGSTFTSGATTAWITDEIGEEALQPVLTRAQHVQLAAAFTGTVAAGALSLLDVALPIVLAGIGFVGLTIGLALRMTERPFAPVPVGTERRFAALVGTARAGLRLARTRPVVRAVLVVSVLAGLAGEAFDRLWQVQVLQAYALPPAVGSNPASYFAGIALVSITVSLAASLLVNRYGAAQLAAVHPGRLLAGLTAVEVAGVIVLAVSPCPALALAALWLKGAAATITAPVLAAWLNRHLDPGVRATVLSLDSQAGAAGQLVGGPPLGLLARHTSVRLTLLVSAGLLAPAAAVLARAGYAADKAHPGPPAPTIGAARDQSNPR